MNKVAVILVSYNRADVTCLAFDALARARNQTPFEVFVIDNKSKIIERDKIKNDFEFLVKNGHLKGEFIQNEKNSGFSAGNNIGLRKALADKSFTHICLLNNDTIVSHYWLDRLVEHNVEGLIGPVSNSVGNEQIVPNFYENLGCNGYTRDNVFEFAEKWHEAHKGQLEKTEMLGFFCVLGPRSLFEKVGILDEAFGIGTYEDDDFCIRCLKAGLPLMIARDVFVHHWGSATFAKLGRNRVYSLMKRNRAIFEKKHGVIWKPHSRAFAKALEAEWRYLAKTNSQNPLVQKSIDWYSNYLGGQLDWLTRESEFLMNASFASYLKWSLRTNTWLPSYVIVFLLAVVSLLHALMNSKYRKNLIGMCAHKGKNLVQKGPSKSIQLMKRVLQKSANSLKWALWERRKDRNHVILLPICPYWGRQQRPQHIANSLAKRNREVIWIEPRKTKFSGFLKGGLENVHLLEINHEFNNFYNSQSVLTEANELKSWLGLCLNPRQKNVVIVQHSYWLGFVEFFRKQAKEKNIQLTVIYDCMDAHSDFGSSLLSSIFYEKNLIQSVDKMVATSTYIYEELKSHPISLSLIRNACSADKFPFISNPQKTRVIGYFGAIAEWFDCDLVLDVARLLPEMTFELIGDYHLSKFSKVELPPNIKLLGEKHFSELPKYAENWDAGIIPFKITPLIKATNPVKLYEYCALGLPTVSTPIPEVIEARIDAAIATTATEFAQKLISAIAEDSDEKHLLRRKFAEANTWENRTAELEGLFG